MEAQLVATIVSAIVALLAAGFTIWGQIRRTRLEADLRREESEEARQREARRVISRYREPLVHAAYELQSRIFNMLELNLISLHYSNGDERSREYVVNNTAFLIGQYFGWSEIIRQEGQFLDLGEIDTTRRLNEIQDALTHTWLRDDLGPFLTIFRGNQRAIGEEMITRSEKGLECIGYAAFLRLLYGGDKSFLNQLQQDVQTAVSHIEASRIRLVALQNKLIELIDFLDPNFVRFPANRRKKLN